MENSPGEMIVQEKEWLESKIKGLISEFEEKTGAVVDQVYLEHRSEPAKTNSVSLELKI